MWSARKIFLLCLFFYEHGSHAFPSGQPGTEAASDEPDLLHMLNFFKGKSDIGEITTLLKEYKVLEALGKGFFEVCGTCKQVFTNAAKTDVGMRILVKAIEGQAPDIKDLYELATKGAGDINKASNDARKKNKNFKTFSSLISMNSSTFLSSASLMEQFLDSFTGKKFSLDPALVKKVNSGQSTFTTGNVAQVNLLLLIAAFKDNFGVMTQFDDSFRKPPFDFNSQLEILQRFNTSTLSKLKVFSGTINDSKYAVSGGTQAFVTHPGAVKLLNDRLKVQQFLKVKSQDQAAAETLVIHYMSDLISLASQVIKAAENQSTFHHV